MHSCTSAKNNTIDFILFYYYSFIIIIVIIIIIIIIITFIIIIININIILSFTNKMKHISCYNHLKIV